MTQNDQISEIHRMVRDINLTIAKSLVHQEQHRKEIDDHGIKLSVLEAYKNKTLGVVSIIGIFFGALAGWLIHLLTK